MYFGRRGGERYVSVGGWGWGFQLIEVDEALDHAVWIQALAVATGRRVPQLWDCASVAHVVIVVAYWSYCGDFGGSLLAVWTVFDDETDGFFDSDPVEFLGDGGGCFVDTTVLQRVHVSCYLVLALRITHHLFVFQHEPFALPAFIG